MSVQFEESTITQNAALRAQARGKQGALTKFFINKGIAKTESQANVIMIGLSICFFALAAFVAFF